MKQGDILTEVTPFHEAAARAPVGIVSMMLGVSRDDVDVITMRDWMGATPLHYAADYCNIHVAKLLAKEFPEALNWKDNEGSTPFERTHKKEVKRAMITGLLINLFPNYENLQHVGCILSRSKYMFGGVGVSPVANALIEGAHGIHSWNELHIYFEKLSKYEYTYREISCIGCEQEIIEIARTFTGIPSCLLFKAIHVVKRDVSEFVKFCIIESILENRMHYVSDKVFHFKFWLETGVR